MHLQHDNQRRCVKKMGRRPYKPGASAILNPDRALTSRGSSGTNICQNEAANRNSTIHKRRHHRSQCAPLKRRSSSPRAAASAGGGLMSMDVCVTVGLRGAHPCVSRKVSHQSSVSVCYRKMNLCISVTPWKTWKLENVTKSALAALLILGSEM